MSTHTDPKKEKKSKKDELPYYNDRPINEVALHELKSKTPHERLKELIKHYVPPDQIPELSTLMSLVREKED